MKNNIREEWSRFFLDHAKAMGMINDEFISIMANFWLGKLSSYTQEVIKRIEGMKKEIPTEKIKNSAELRAIDYNRSFNSALGDVINLLKENE